MRTPFARLAFVVPFLTPLAAAQDAPLLEEDFLNGAIEWFVHDQVQLWHITTPGECGAPGGWASSALSQSPCVYGTPPWAFVSVLTSPEFVPAGGPLRLNFLSRLELEAGDSVSVRLMPPSISTLPPLVLATHLDLTNDSAPEAIEILAPGADLYGGLACHLRFDVLHDGSGDVGFGWMIDEVVLVDQPVAPAFCVGDPAVGNCPCANFGAPDEGCAHDSTTGAKLVGAGSARVAADDLELTALGGPAGQPAVLFGGSLGTPTLFRDGVLCIGAPQERLARVHFDATGAAGFGAPLAGLVDAQPGTRGHYQLWYRSPGGACASGSNFSSGVAIDWL